MGHSKGKPSFEDSTNPPPKKKNIESLIESILRSAKMASRSSSHGWLVQSNSREVDIRLSGDGTVSDVEVGRSAAKVRAAFAHSPSSSTDSPKHSAAFLVQLLPRTQCGDGRATRAVSFCANSPAWHSDATCISALCWSYRRCVASPALLAPRNSHEHESTRACRRAHALTPPQHSSRKFSVRCRSAKRPLFGLLLTARTP